MEYIGQQIGNYSITRLIGEGGMATVYEGEHETLGTKAAIKILNPILSANKQIRERFKNEARMMASLDHPNITRVLDFKESDTYLAITMEYLAGEDLSNRIKNMGKLPEEEIKRIFEQILAAFQYAHDMGIVHRDIKPSNIFILPNGTVKILDFGIAKLFGQGNEMTQTGTQMGTPIYMSPEQVKADKTIDHRSDIYSLGVTLFYALSGKPPYDGSTMSQFDIFTQIVHEPLPEIESKSYLADLIRKACQKDREQRFQSCDEWQKVLKQGVSTKTETQLSEKTIVEPATSDKTVFESPNAEKNIEEATVVRTSGDQIISNSEVEKTSSKEINKKVKKDWIFSVFGIVILVIAISFAMISFFRGLATISETGELVIDINGNSYKTVIIGEQIWMAENLNVDKFRNGDSIPEAKSNEEWSKAFEEGKPAWCYYENNQKNGEKYGKLYNWYAINDMRGLAPNGYHIPSDKEWLTLSYILGGDNVAGKKMKSNIAWNGTNESGFSALDGRFRFNDPSDIANWGSPEFKVTIFWSSTEFEPGEPVVRSLGQFNEKLHSPRNYSRGSGFYVRCVKD